MSTRKLGDFVKFDVDGGKPARNPKTIFGFDLLSPTGRKVGPKLKKVKQKQRKKEFEQ